MRVAFLSCITANLVPRYRNTYGFMGYNDNYDYYLVSPEAGIIDFDEVQEHNIKILPLLDLDVDEKKYNYIDMLGAVSDTIMKLYLNKLVYLQKFKEEGYDVVVFMDVDMYIEGSIDHLIKEMYESDCEAMANYSEDYTSHYKRNGFWIDEIPKKFGKKMNDGFMLFNCNNMNYNVWEEFKKYTKGIEKFFCCPEEQFFEQFLTKVIRKPEINNTFFSFNDCERYSIHFGNAFCPYLVKFRAWNFLTLLYVRKYYERAVDKTGIEDLINLMFYKLTPEIFNSSNLDLKFKKKIYNEIKEEKKKLAQMGFKFEPLL